MNIDTLANAIKARGEVVTADSLMVQSLFHSGGTLTVEQANELLWEKRTQLEAKSRRKYPNAETWVWSIPFLYWTGERK